MKITVFYSFISRFMDEEANLETFIKEGFGDFHIKQGNFNILVVGRSGVGKSTLINSIFEENVAETGVGKPITLEKQTYSKSNYPITICDTRGLEMSDYNSISVEIQALVNSKINTKDSFHCAWFCVQKSAKRFEEGELRLYEFLKSNMPVIMVITQSIDEDSEIVSELQKTCPDAKHIIPVMAVEMELEVCSIPQKGLKELIKATISVIPQTFPNLEQLITEGFQDFQKKLGKLNIIIAGRSGVGKSTLLNAIFDKDIAKTGVGKPVTENIHIYSKDGYPITICDTRGLEILEYAKTLEALEKEVCEKNLSKNISEHYHCAWFCINEQSNRFKEGENSAVNF
jgi:predicted GTPase